jgi:hypothetical protein
MLLASRRQLTAQKKLFFVGAALRLVGVAAAEFLHTAGRIDEHVFAGVEGVRSTAHFDFNHRVGVAVFPLNRLGGRHRGAGNKFEVRRGVLENYLAVLGVRVLFHIGRAYLPIKPCRFCGRDYKSTH